MAVVLSVNSLAALMTMKAGLVIRSCAFTIAIRRKPLISSHEFDAGSRTMARVAFGIR